MEFAYTQPVVGALAVVVQDRKVLLVRRAKAPNCGLWGFPGGKVELGEHVSEAARRELHEETGLSAAPGEYMVPVDVIERGAHPESTLHFVLVPVRMAAARGTPAAADDAAEVRWFTLADLKSERDSLCEHVLQLGQSVLEPRPTPAGGSRTST